MESNEKNTHLGKTEPADYETVNDKKKVVLGEEDFSSGSDKPDTEKYQDSEPAKTEKSPQKSGGFFKNILGKVSGSSAPHFDEEKENENAKEIVKNLPEEIFDNEKAPSEGETYMKSEKDKIKSRNKNRFILILVSLIIFALLFWFIPFIQKAMFQTKDNSLIFRSATGVLGPRSGIIMIAAGILSLIGLFFTFFNGRKEERITKDKTVKKGITLRQVLAVLALLIPIGVTTIFNFTEFRKDNIRVSNVFNRNKMLNYTEVTKQNIFMDGTDVVYGIEIGGHKVKVPIYDYPAETIRLLDSKMNPQRNIRIDSDVIKEIVNKKIYTEQEAVKVYKIISQ